MRQRQLGIICFPSLYQVPIDVTAVSPVDTRPPGPHLYSWVYWSNVSKVSCSRKQQQHQSGHTGNRTHNLSISRPIPWPLGYVASHTHTHTHTRVRAHTHAPTYPLPQTHRHTDTHTHILTHPPSFPHTNTHIHNHTHICTHARTHTHTHTHTMLYMHTHMIKFAWWN